MAMLSRFLLLLLVSSTAAFRPRRHATVTSAAAALHLRGGDGAAAGAVKDAANAVKEAAAEALSGDLEMASGAFEWCGNLGAPAALVGGAVLATMEATRSDLSPKRSDSHRRRVVKQLTRALLLSAFALEIVSIFVTTVTGTMLLAQGDRPTGELAGQAYHSPMGFLHHNHEFEYLTARITFLQGLFNWLAATALEMAIPQPGEGEAARRMNAFISASLVSLILLMLSFYNAHMSFYSNYGHMLWIYAKSVWKRFFLKPRMMALLYIPCLVYTCVLGTRTFISPSFLDNDDE